MTLRRLSALWNEFFFEEHDPLTLDIFRIMFGLIACANLLILRPDWLTWFGSHGVVSLETVKSHRSDFNFGLFELCRTDDQLQAIFWVLLLAEICLTIGLLSKVSCVITFLGLHAIHERNMLMLHSGDTLIRVVAFLLMFAPLGSTLSLDSFIFGKRLKKTARPGLVSWWAPRMIQLQLSALYCITAYWKTVGLSWADGTAVYYALHLFEFRKFPVPESSHLWAYAILSWATVAIELSCGILIWIREFRYIVMAFGLGLHLSIEYAMNIPLFEWATISIYILFVSPSDLRRWIQTATQTFSRRETKAGHYVPSSPTRSSERLDRPNFT